MRQGRFIVENVRIARAGTAVLLLLGLAGTVGAAVPNYAELDAVLLRNVRNGFVDYDGIRADPAFGRFVTSVGNAESADLEGASDRLAFLLNAYNALTIQGVLEGAATESRRQRNRFFEREQHRVLGRQVTLRQLEKEEILLAGDPRVHFALSCATLSCPRLANRAYVAARLDAQLDAAARTFVNDGSRNRFDSARRIAFLAPVFAEHGAAFTDRAGSLQRYLAAYAADPAVAELLRRDAFDVRYLDEDNELNGLYRGRPE